MKKLLFIAIIAVLGCTALQAKNRIRIKRESWEVKASTRVPISTPLNLYYEGSTLFIHANIDLENIITEVKDSFNKTIYLDLTSIQANNEHVFTLENISSGEYIIEIKSGENYIIGCFIL